MGKPSIYFRRVDEPFEASDVERWQVEYYDGVGTMFPCGLAWFVVSPKHNIASLNFILVADQWRREGIGKKILLECKKRYPKITFTESMDEKGAGLLKSMGEYDANSQEEKDSDEETAMYSQQVEKMLPE